MLERGADIVTISKLYGHSSVLVTQRYLHPKDKLSKEAVELLVEKPGWQSGDKGRNRTNKNASNLFIFNELEMPEKNNALDSKSSSLHGECGFDSLLRHQFSSVITWFYKGS